MLCPKCGAPTCQVAENGVVIDECRNCGVVVLDPGELEAYVNFVIELLGIDRRIRTRAPEHFPHHPDYHHHGHHGSYDFFSGLFSS